MAYPILDSTNKPMYFRTQENVKIVCSEQRVQEWWCGQYSERCSTIFRSKLFWRKDLKKKNVKPCDDVSFGRGTGLPTEPEDELMSHVLLLYFWMFGCSWIDLEKLVYANGIRDRQEHVSRSHTVPSWIRAFLHRLVLIMKRWSSHPFKYSICYYWYK